jgi:hypothetical protein
VAAGASASSIGASFARGVGFGGAAGAVDDGDVSDGEVELAGEGEDGVAERAVR